MTNTTQTKDKNYWYSKLLHHSVIWKYPGYGPHAKYVMNDNHSDFYINTDYLAYDPALLKEVCSDLHKSIELKTNLKPDWIITYSPGGNYIGFCLAELFNCKFGLIKSLKEPSIYFDLRPHDTVLLCADVSMLVRICLI